MHYHQYQPPESLKHYVRYLWSYESRGDEAARLHIRSFADQFPRLIFQDILHYETIRTAGGEAMPACYLSGLDTRPTDAIMRASFSHFGVSFYPHALPVFFGIHANELVNTTPDINLVLNSSLTHDLTHAASHRERAERVCRFLHDRLIRHAYRDPATMTMLLQGDLLAETDLAQLSRSYRLSTRQLERRFKTSVGISPKKFQRLIRFENSLRLLAQADYAELTHVAHTLQYSDQSHFIHEFREFAGMTPYAFVRARSLGRESCSFIYHAE